MPKIFSSYAFDVSGHVLSKEDFLPFREQGGLHLNPKETQKLIAEAESMLNEPYPLLTASLYHEVFRSGSRLQFETPQRRRRELLMTFFMAEYAERKGRFTDRIVDGIWLLCEESTWNLPNHVPCGSFFMPDSGIPMQHLDLFSSEAGSNFAWMYYLGKEILDPISPAIRPRMQAEIRKRIITPFLEHEFAYFGSEENPKAGNWCVWVISNVLAATAFTEEDMAVREAVVRRAMQFADRYPNGLPEDGSCIEGPRYYGHGVGSYFDTLELLSDMTNGYVQVFDHPFVRSLGEYAYKMHICGNNYFAYGDAPFLLQLPYRFFYRYGQRIGSEELMQFARSFAAQEIPEQFGTYYHTYRALADLNVPDLAPVTWEPPKEVWQPDFGLLALRENADAEKGFYLGVHCGHNAEGHGHIDTGVFTVFSDGKPVVIDPGVGEYRADTFSNDRSATFWFGSSSHNLPRIAGCDQRSGMEAAATDRQYDPASKTLCVTLTSAYPEKAGVRAYRRQYALQNGKITVSDRIQTASPCEINFFYTCYEQPVPASAGKIHLHGGLSFSYPPAMHAEISYIPCDSASRAAYLGRDGVYLICLTTDHKDEQTYTVTIARDEKGPTA